MTLTEAQKQYRDAWDEYRTNFDPKRKKELERLMDGAQDYFTNDQFQEFKVTLPGFIEYWNFLGEKGHKAIKEWQSLAEFAEKMRQVAKQNPHNQDRKFMAPEVCHEEVEVDGIRVNVVLTYNVWDSLPVVGWQLSLSRTDYQGLLADSTTNKLVTALLGTNDVVELTGMMPPEAMPNIIRQFVCQT